MAAHAWGDPASGGFALLVNLETRAGGSELDDLPVALKSAAEVSGARITEWNRSSGSAALEFEWRGFRGVARVRATKTEGTGGLRATMLACFYTERQPARSAQSCRAVMEQFEEMP